MEVIGCVLCAVVCLTPALRTNGLLVGASLLAIAAIFCKRVQLLVGGFQITNLGEMTPFANSMSITHWEGTMADAYAGMVYWPTPLEFGVTLGVVALGFLIFFLGLKFLPCARPRCLAFQVAAFLRAGPRRPFPWRGPLCRHAR